MLQPYLLYKWNLWIIVLVVLLGFSLVSLKPTQAAPIDPMAGSTPSFDSTPEEGTNYNNGDWGVSEQNGAATYTFPINVPTGRNGMAPSLSLRYSSNLPLRGGLAVGWNLRIPSITEDLSLGVTKKTHYKIDLGSASGRLVKVSDTILIPMVQPIVSNLIAQTRGSFSSNPNFFQTGIKGWIALTPDGIRHYFEKSRNPKNKRVWHITSQVDSYGNTVRYIWKDLVNTNDVHLGQSLIGIEYTSNDAAHLIPHAKVEFEYDPMIFCFDTDTSGPIDRSIVSDLPLGAAYRKGSKLVTGAQQLAAIKIHVRDSQTSDWRLSKQIDLQYLQTNSILYKKPPDHELNPLPPHLARCKQNPLRYLTQIDVEAFDADGTGTSLPPIKLQYNNRIDTSARIVPAFERIEMV